jgi:hypothetical protein
MWPIENIVIVAAIALVLLFNAFVLLAVRALVVLLGEQLVRYRPGGFHRAGEGDETADTEAEDSPLRAVFQRYGALTDRMAELVFRLTDLRGTGHAEPAVRMAEIRKVMAPTGEQALPAVPPEASAAETTRARLPERSISNPSIKDKQP